MSSTQIKAPPFSSYSQHLLSVYGRRVQKIGVDAGFTCPNRDGTQGVGGCSYCNIASIRPKYCAPARSVSAQLTDGIDFFNHKYRHQGYIAYFQSFSSTYAPLSILENLYREALNMPQILGLSIATRPDCVSHEVVDLLTRLQEEYQKDVTLELGIESTIDRTLCFINRGHSVAESERAAKMAIGSGLRVSAHIILGLPGESFEDQLSHGRRISRWGIGGVKIHHLQILKNTPMAFHFTNQEWPGHALPTLYTVENYITVLSSFIQGLHPRMVVERLANDAPRTLIIAPQWGGMKNYALAELLTKTMIHNGHYQGQHYRSKDE